MELARYQRELETFRARAGSGASEGAGGASSDGGKKGREALAWRLFDRNTRPRLKMENPAASAGELGRLLKQQWQARLPRPPAPRPLPVTLRIPPPCLSGVVTRRGDVAW